MKKLTLSILSASADSVRQHSRLTAFWASLTVTAALVLSALTPAVTIAFAMPWCG